MDSNLLIKLIIDSILVLALNIPFGYWRDDVGQFTLQWILAVHIPVPLIVFIRLLSGVGFAWYTYLFLVLAYFLGQRLGAYIHRRNTELEKIVSGCLVMDALRNRKQL